MAAKQCERSGLCFGPQSWDDPSDAQRHCGYSACELNIRGPATKPHRVRRHEKRVEDPPRWMAEELPKCSECFRRGHNALGDDRVRHGRTIVSPRKYKPRQVEQGGHGGGPEEELKPFAPSAPCHAGLIEQENCAGK